MACCKNGKFKIFKWGAIFGSIAGVIGGLLFAPKKGEELREDLDGQYKKFKKDKYPDVKEKMDKTVGDVKEKLPGIKAKIKTTIKDVRGKAKQEIDDAKVALEEHLAEKQK